MFLNVMNFLSASASAIVRMQLVIPSAYFAASAIVAISTPGMWPCSAIIGFDLLRGARFAMRSVVVGIGTFLSFQKGSRFGQLQMLELVLFDVFDAIDDMTALAQFQECRSPP
jgi:hypothetical protein